MHTSSNRLPNSFRSTWAKISPTVVGGFWNDKAVALCMEGGGGQNSTPFRLDLLLIFVRIFVDRSVVYLMIAIGHRNRNNRLQLVSILQEWVPFKSATTKNFDQRR